MTADDMQVPAAPTPYTPAQIAAVWGANAMTTYPDEAAIPALACVAEAALTPDSPSLPPEPRRYPRLTLRRLDQISADIAQVRQAKGWTDPNDEVA